MKITLLLFFLVGIPKSLFSQWQMVDSSNSNVMNDFVDVGNYLFVVGGNHSPVTGVSTGILKRSSDDGVTWQTISNGLSEGNYHNQIAGSGEEVYLQSSGSSAIGSGYIFHSVDGGLNWTKVSNGIGGYGTTELLYDGTTVLALLNNEFYASNDSGKSWTSKSKITSNASLKGLVTDGTRYYSYSPALNGYYYSDDKCGTWNLSSTPNTLMNSFSTDGKNMYMVANDATQSLYMLVDSGKTLVTGKPVGGTAYSIDKIAGRGDMVFAAEWFIDNYVYLSTDQMKTWTNVGDGLSTKSLLVNKIIIKGDYVYLGFIGLGTKPTQYQIWRRKLSEMGIATEVKGSNQAPVNFLLMQNYPNPFNPSTTIGFTLQSSGLVSLKVYDVVGREVATLLNENKAAGYYSVTFNAAKLPSGIYYYRLHSGSVNEIKKMTLAK